MTLEEIKKVQYEKGMEMAARGEEPDSIMLMDPEEYLAYQMGSRYNQIEDITPPNNPFGLVGSTHYLETIDFSIASFKYGASTHPLRAYLSNIIDTLNRAFEDEVDQEQLEEQKSIFMEIVRSLKPIKEHFQSEYEADLEAANRTYNYLDRMEYNKDAQRSSINAQEVTDLITTSKKGINLIDALIELHYGSR